MKKAFLHVLPFAATLAFAMLLGLSVRHGVIPREFFWPGAIVVCLAGAGGILWSNCSDENPDEPGMF